MFGIGAKKHIVGLTVTPNLGLEAVVYDEKTKQVLKYGQKFIEYNIASREIQDIGSFKMAAVDLFSELDISKENSNIYLVIPNVLFGFKSIQDNLIDIDSLIADEAMQSYIFKQEDAISSWVNINSDSNAQNKYIAYSSIQAKAVADIQDAITDIGYDIAGIETAVTAIPRGIALTGVCDDLILNNQSWDILLINQNNYAIFQMSGNRILDYVEIPFAVMSFEGDEIYSALSSAIGQYLPNYPAKKLVIVSQTDNVSASMLKQAVVFDEEIISFDSNRFSTNPYMDISDEVIKQMAASMSLSVLGASVPKWGNFATLNVIGNISYNGGTSYGTINFGGMEIDLTSDMISSLSVKLSVLLGIVAILVIGGLAILTGGLVKGIEAKQGEIDTINAEIEQLNKQLKSSLVALIKEITENNKQSMNYYDSLSTDIPSNVWLTYYINKNGKEVGIEGLSININDIYAYYRSLKMLAPSSDIKLNKLDVFKEEENESSSDIDQIVLNEANGQQTFSFEVSNTSYVKTFDEKGNKKELTEEEKKENASSNNSGKKSSGSAPNVPDVDPNLEEVP